MKNIILLSVIIISYITLMWIVPIVIIDGFWKTTISIFINHAIPAFFFWIGSICGDWDDLDEGGV